MGSGRPGVRYRFTGLRREWGQPVMGHVEAESEDRAYDILGDNGIVAEGLAADPERTDDSHQPGLASAIDHALAASSHSVPFDSLRGRYEGKHVWVVDREKIKTRVLQTVDEVIRQSRRQAEDDTTTHDRLTDALERLFGDNRNLTTPLTASQEAMEIQLNRLTDVVRELEHATGAIRSATRRSGGGDGGNGGNGGPGRAVPRRRLDAACDDALREIFQMNVQLRRRLAGADDEREDAQTNGRT